MELWILKDLENINASHLLEFEMLYMNPNVWHHLVGPRDYKKKREEQRNGKECDTSLVQ